MFATNIEIYRAQDPNGLDALRTIIMARLNGAWYLFTNTGLTQHKWLPATGLAERFCDRAVADARAERIDEDTFYRMTKIEFLKSAAQPLGLHGCVAPLDHYS